MFTPTPTLTPTRTQWHTGLITTKMGKHHYVTYDDGDTRKYRMHLHCFKVLDKATGAVIREFVRKPSSNEEVTKKRKHSGDS